MSALLVSVSAWACPDGVRPVPTFSLAPAAVRQVQAGGVLRILAIGSSSTAGAGASRPQMSYPAQLAGLLEGRLGQGRVEVTNAGVNGESAPATLKRLEAFLAAPERPDVLLWQVGTNDVLFGGAPERLKGLVLKGLDAAQAAGVATVVIDQQYFPLIVDVPRYEQFVAAVDDAAAARGVSILNRYAMMKQWSVEDPEGFRRLFWWDRFHMNDSGYACLAQELAGAIADAVVAAKAPAAAGRNGAMAPAARQPTASR